MLHEPVWLQIARGDIGLREIPGAPTAPRISQWLSKLGAWWRDDETPWCGVAVAGWMLQAGIDDLPKHWYRARGWLEWGLPLDRALLGCGVGVVIAQWGGFALRRLFIANVARFDVLTDPRPAVAEAGRVQRPRRRDRAVFAGEAGISDGLVRAVPSAHKEMGQGARRHHRVCR